MASEFSHQGARELRHLYANTQELCVEGFFWGCNSLALLCKAVQPSTHLDEPGGQFAK